jgi:hypothetical protein
MSYNSENKIVKFHFHIFKELYFVNICPRNQQQEDLKSKVSEEHSGPQA